MAAATLATGGQRYLDVCEQQVSPEVVAVA